LAFSRASRFGSTEVGLVVSEVGFVVVSETGLVVSELRLVVSSCACTTNTEKRRVIKKKVVLNKDRCMGLYSISLEISTVNVCLYL